MSAFDRLRGLIVESLQVEALEPIPGKDKGYYASDTIDGHKVQLAFHHKTKGKYVPVITVNGKVHKEADFPAHTNLKIGTFLLRHQNEFLKDVKPSKVQIIATDKKKRDAYRTVAKSRMTQDQGYKAKDSFRGVTLTPQKPQEHKPSGNYKPSSSSYSQYDDEKDLFKKKKSWLKLSKAFS